MFKDMKESMMNSVEEFCDTLDLLQEPMNRVFGFLGSVVTRGAGLKLQYYQFVHQHQVERVKSLAQALDGKSEAAIQATAQIILREMDHDNVQSLNLLAMADSAVQRLPETLGLKLEGCEMDEEKEDDE